MSRATEKITFEIYRDVDKKWRSRLLRKAFGKTFIIADGGEGYANKADVMKTTENIIKAISAGNVTVVAG